MSDQALTSPRRSRWQLSLRMLLLLMAMVGIGLTVYRWPWVESKWFDVTAPVDPFSSSIASKVVYRYEQRTTYRRNWRAQPIRNGVEQCWRDGRLWHESHYYEGELHGPRRVYDAQGKVTYEVHFRHGQYHGSACCRYGNDFKWKGEFLEGRPHGPWESTVSYQSQFGSLNPADFVELDHPESAWLMKAPVRILSNWDRGQRHGDWTWKWQEEGHVIRTATYSQGDLVRWNGEPLVENFLAMLRKHPDQEGVQETLRLLNAADKGDWRVGYMSEIGDWGYCLELDRKGSPAERLFVYGVNLPRHYFADESRNLTPALCELAAISGCRLEYRYGGLLLVPREDGDQPSDDPTGVESVKFEAGSPIDRDWNEVIDILSSASSGRACVEELLRDSAIGYEVDRSSIARYSGASRDGPSLFRRRRRDAIGLICYLTGLRCEHRSEKLLFTANADQTSWQALHSPLQPPWFPVPRH